MHDLATNPNLRAANQQAVAAFERQRDAQRMAQLDRSLFMEQVNRAYGHDTGARDDLYLPRNESTPVRSTVGGTGVGQPGTLEGFVPIWGSGRAAVDDFQNGNWGWGTFNSVMAVSDVLLVKTAGTIVVKGAWKGGSHTWNATRSWLGRRGFAEKWQHVHHAIVSQQYFRGTKLEAIFNQPWNLRALEPPPGVTMDTWHKMIEGKLPGLNMAERWWYGMPDWFRYGQISVV